MTANVHVEPWIQQVRAEHLELGRQLDVLRALFREPRPDDGGRSEHEWAAELGAHLVRLHEELYRHFRFEEEGGMVRDIAAGHPEAATRIRGIVAQHPWMLRDVRGLVVSALACSAGELPHAPELREHLALLLDELHRHERAETALVQRVEYGDIGAVD